MKTQLIWFPVFALVLACCSSVIMPAPPDDLDAAAVAHPPTSPPAASLTAAGVWHPAAGVSWQIQFSGDIDLTVPATLYDLDLFETDAEMVDNLHTEGKKVICYLNAGAWEDWRPDADQFPPEVIGRDYSGWQGEKWLDIRQIEKLAPILRARLDMCAAKGFDGVDPDNIDGYTNETGFPLLYADQMAFNQWLSQEARHRGLAVGLKNDSGQAGELLSSFDWAITEDCFAEGWCAEMQPFLDAGKPVLAIEYTDRVESLDPFCVQAHTLGVSLILKNRSLDAFHESCSSPAASKED